MKENSVHKVETQNDGQTYATREEIEQAIKALSVKERKSLMVSARFWSRKFGLKYSFLSPEDLFQEALFRCLKEERARNWPKHISFVKFLSRTMESIASHHVEKMKLENRDLIPAPTEDKDPISKIQEQNEIERVRKLFERDPKAFEVLVLKSHGLDAKEIMDELELSPTDWETIRKQIQRKLANFVKD